MFAEDLTIIRWQSVHFVKENENIPEKELEEREVKVFEIDGKKVKEEKSLFFEIAGVMKFPEYFGYNWDALDDCLKDLNTWLPAEGCFGY